MGDAYENARNGGLHSRWLLEQRALGVRQLQSAERSLLKQVRLHEGWIAAPESKVHDWTSRDSRYQEGLLKKWQQDQKRQREQIDIVRGVLREKESENG